MNDTTKHLIACYNEGYRISKCGKYIEFKGKKEFQKSFTVEGYPRYSVKIINIRRCLIWHRLQAYQKYGEKVFEKGIVVRHLNAIKTDCSWDNILIGTYSDNSFDRPKEERLRISKMASSKCIKYDIQKIKNFHSLCKSYKKTMAEFGISSGGTLHCILKSNREI